MKKIAISLLFYLSFSSISKAQVSNNGITDTTLYLQSIVAQKQLFIGKPFQVLLDSLKINVKGFTPTSGIAWDNTKECSTRIFFYFSEPWEDFYLTFPALRIFWQTPLDKNISDSNHDTNSDGKWNNGAVNIYKNAIVRNISLVE